MRRLSVVLLLILLVALVEPAAPVSAASFVANETGAQPENLNPGFRFIASADTAYGQGITLELNDTVANSYTRTACTYLNSNNLPSGTTARYECRTAAAIAPGRLVNYQFMVCNYGELFSNCHAYTGFNFSFTSPSPPQGNIQWDAVLHDTFNADYRSIVGPTTPNATVRLRVRVAQGDITAARVRVWNDRLNAETYSAMNWDGSFDNSTTYDWWTVDLPTGTNPTVLYYIFELTDQNDQDFYVDDDVKFYGGGYGAMSDGYDDGRSFQITVYDPAFSVPAWMQRGVVYQIFPDRFRDGDGSNNPQAGRFSYGEPVAIVRSNGSNWNTTVCDPRAAGACFGRYGDNFYGGDLKGITQQIQQGYFDALGVSVLYLNPIFRAPSNHKYDTANFMEIDPDFGTLADFQALVAAANARDIRIMLDGVFNHTSSDSPYFDRYGRYDAAGQLVAPGGSNDGSGACEAVSSGYRSWFYFPAGGNPGKDGATVVYCADAAGNPTVTYEAWYGYSSLPKINSGLPEVRSYFYGSAGAVGPYWTQQGASGWRFDVGADVDPGLTNDPANGYWEGFRAAVRNPALTGKSDVVMLGEEWGDASGWLLGNEWDSVMNYRFRSALLSWMFTGCSGNGCVGGTKFQENDSNDFSSSGAITALSPSQFNARLRSIHEDYPPQAFAAMMNLAGSHDTQRLRFLLKMINNGSDATAVQRMKEWWLFAFSYGGAPTLYYGDEVGLSHDGVWDGSQYQDDPYNRTPFPWGDTPGAYVADTDLLAFARHMSSVRHSYRALQDGDVQHGLVIDDARRLYGFARTTGSQTALVLLNRSDGTQTGSFGGLGAAPYNLADGTVLVDVLSGASYSVTGGALDVVVTSNWGAVLLEQAKIETPAAPVSLSLVAPGADVVLNWPLVAKDTTNQREVATQYEVHRGQAAGFTPGPATLLATVAAPTFGSSGANVSYTAAEATGLGGVYAVVARNAAGKGSVPTYAAVVTNAAVRPVLECVADRGADWADPATRYEARFGYKNDNSVGVTIAVGTNNRFHPLPQNRGQVTVFQPSRVVDAFRVAWGGGNLVWTLKGPDGAGRTSTASPSSKRCTS